MHVGGRWHAVLAVSTCCRDPGLRLRTFWQTDRQGHRALLRLSGFANLDTTRPCCESLCPRKIVRSTSKYFRPQPWTDNNALPSGVGQYCHPFSYPYPPPSPQSFEVRQHLENFIPNFEKPSITSFEVRHNLETPLVTRW
jgi:hypothetical protein